MKKINIRGVAWYLIIIIILSGITYIPVIAINKLTQKDIHTEEVKQEIQEETPKVEEKKEITKTPKKTKTNNKKQKNVKPTTKNNNKSQTNVVNTSGTYKITHYGWDCCKSGVTATGYNVKNTIYYNDSQYGKVRIVAMSKAMPLYSIIKIKNYKFGGDIIAIVIDRGVGNGVIDLLVENEKTASKYGIQKGVSIEILRKGK